MRERFTYLALYLWTQCFQNYIKHIALRYALHVLPVSMKCEGWWTWRFGPHLVVDDSGAAWPAGQFCHSLAKRGRKNKISEKWISKLNLYKTKFTLLREFQTWKRCLLSRCLWLARFSWRDGSWGVIADVDPHQVCSSFHFVSCFWLKLSRRLFDPE